MGYLHSFRLNKKSLWQFDVQSHSNLVTKTCMFLPPRQQWLISCLRKEPCSPKITVFQLRPASLELQMARLTKLTRYHLKPSGSGCPSNSEISEFWCCFLYALQGLKPQASLGFHFRKTKQREKGEERTSVGYPFQDCNDFDVIEVTTGTD